MNFRPAFVVPIYNHGKTIRHTVEALLPFQIPVYITDDGSDEETRREITAVVRLSSLVRHSRFARNQGKGAAVLDAMRRAWSDQHTHVVQIDADGQHDFSDIPRFLKIARSQPSAIIAGQAHFDQSVPKARAYGRLFTHLWVWIETLSFAISDSMCGFRVYPLAETIHLMARVQLPTRMDFDVAIIVRLFWAGVPVVNVSTRVTYPKDGVSHFHLWGDNLRIARTHAFLVFGMLLRVPRLLRRRWRRGLAEGKTSWSKIAERGSLLGLKTVCWTYRFLGRRCAKGLLLPVTLYFFLTGRTARRSSLAYLRRVYSVFGPLPLLPHYPGWKEAFRHFYCFAESALDKVVAWLGCDWAIRVACPDHTEIERLASQGCGAVLIGAHIGNMEVSRAIAVQSGISGINAVVYSDHVPRFTTMLRESNAEYSLNLIQASSLDPQVAILLQDKIEHGELIFIVGDRIPVRENGRTSRTLFLGREAAFPQGPFLLAGSLACPVYLFFCLKEKGVYRIYLERFAERIQLPRENRQEALDSLIARFARRLESYCRREPLQWFNFFEFWGDTSNSKQGAVNG